MARRNRRRGASWELIGIVAVLALVGVALLFAVLSGTGGGGVAAPDFSSIDPGFAAGAQDEPEPIIESGFTEDGRPYLGTSGAPVTFYEFADFQCSHCREFTTNLSKEIKEDYIETGQARLVFVNFAFLGDESSEAAKAALCAGDQGRFWAMHDWLFANQATVANSGGYARDRILRMGEAAGVERDALSSCLSDSATADRVQNDKDFALRNSVGSTPSFLIGDTLVEGNDIPGLRTALDNALAEG